jgi:protein-tyrosine phosphatase
VESPARQSATEHGGARHHAAAAPRRPFTVAFVCTGNRFRSPLAAEYLRRLLPDVEVEVSSCGCAPPRVADALPEALEAAASSGLELSGHTVAALHEVDLASADLVVGFERTHVAHAVVDERADRDRAFTLPELVELLRVVERPPSAEDAPAVARELVAAAAAVRRANRHPRREIQDPLGKSREVAGAVATEIWELTSELAQRLFPGHSVAIPEPTLEPVGSKRGRGRRGVAPRRPR